MSRSNTPSASPASRDSDSALSRGAVFDQSSSAACSVAAMPFARTARRRSRLTTIRVPSRPPSLRLASFIGWPSCGNQFGDIIVQRREASIQRGEATVVPSRERGETGIGDLAMAENTIPAHGAVIQIIGPEAMRRVCDEQPQDAERIVDCRRRASQQDTQQRALRDRTRGERLVTALAEPSPRGLVMDVAAVAERNQYIGIKQMDHGDPDPRLPAP